MTQPRQIQFVRGNTQCVNHYVGPIGSFAINLDDWSIHIQDGVTPGGHIVSGAGGAGSYSNANVQAYGLVFEGDLRPTGNSAHSLGSIDHQWKDLFLSNSTIYLNGVALSLNTDNNLTVNGKVIDLGNFKFDADRQYDINGFALENSDATHGYTSRLAIPVNGSGDAELVNFYGNVNLTAGYNNGDLKTWTLGQDGALTIPNGGKLGGLQFADGIDLYADRTMSYTQINYDNTNYIYADPNVSQLQTPNVNVIANTTDKEARIQVADPDLARDNTWTFDAKGNIHLGGSGRLGKVWNDPGEATLVAGDGGYAALANSTGDQYIDADDSVVQIGTNWTSGHGNTWFFNKDGTVTFPDYTRQSTAYPGPQDLSNYAWNANVADANVAMKGYVDQQLTNLINNAPVALDTLKELADALADDPNFASSITLMISNVQANVNAVTSSLGNYAWNANLSTYAWNANVTASNIGMKGYVDAINTSLTANSYQQQALIGNLQASAYSNANVASYMPIYGGNVLANNVKANVLTVALDNVAVSTGQIAWDWADRTFNMGMDNGVVLQVGQEQYIRVKASEHIYNGNVVMFSGTAGDNIQGAKSDVTIPGFRDEYIIGIATQDILVNDFGYITTFGKVHGVDTNGWNVGDLLWVSQTVTGTLTNVEPTNGPKILVAAVIKKSGGDGHLMVRPTFSANLDAYAKLTDVSNANVAMKGYVDYQIANLPIGGGSSYGNANVASYLPTYSGNINATYYTGNGALLTGLTLTNSLGDVDIVSPHHLDVLGFNAFTGLWEAIPQTGGNANAGGISLTSLSVAYTAPAGGGNLTYDNVSGIFSFHSADLTPYALQANLSNYALQSNLSNYALNSNLTSYATTTSLSNYALNSNIANIVLISSVAPTITSYSPLWYNTVDGRTYVAYQNAWIDASPAVIQNLAPYALNANLATYAWNANVTAANIGMLGYVNQANTIQSAQISNLTNNMYTNANVQAYSVVWASDFRPSANLTYNIGNVTNRWNAINSNTVNTTANIYSGSDVVAQGNVWSLGGNFRTAASNVFVANATPTTAWAFGAASTINIGAASSLTTFGSGTGNIAGLVNGFAIGYRDIPQVAFTSNTTITTSDAGKHYYSTVTTNPLTLTIANNATQSFSIGAAINIINQGTGNITLAQGSGVTLYLAGNSISGSRTLTSYGMATITKVATDTWWAVGVGLS